MNKFLARINTFLWTGVWPFRWFHARGVQLCDEGAHAWKNVVADDFPLGQREYAKCKRCAAYGDVIAP